MGTAGNSPHLLQPAIPALDLAVPALEVHASAVPTLPSALLGFCAYGSGTGKTTLLAQLVPALTARGLRISVIKHAHHSFDIDHPGKDSYRLREAGAVQMMIGSRQRWALITELKRTGQAEAEPQLADLVAAMDLALTDLILVEGFKHEAIAKIEVHRGEMHTPLLALSDNSIIAVATDDITLQAAQPRLDLNNIAGIADFVVDWLAAGKPAHNSASLL